MRKVSASKIMSGDWLYTVFDNSWNPSDALEDALSQIEGRAARLFTRLHNPAHAVTPADRRTLNEFLALQACRHPDVMGRGYRRARELGEFIAATHSFPAVADFVAKAATFGIPKIAAEQMHSILTPLEPARLVPFRSTFSRRSRAMPPKRAPRHICRQKHGCMPLQDRSHHGELQYADPLIDWSVGLNVSMTNGTLAPETTHSLDRLQLRPEALHSTRGVK